MTVASTLAFSAGCSAQSSGEKQPTQKQIEAQSEIADKEWEAGMADFYNKFKKSGADLTYDKDNCIAFDAEEGFVVVKNPVLFNHKGLKGNIDFVIYGQDSEGSRILYNGPYIYYPKNTNEPAISGGPPVSPMKEKQNFVNANVSDDDSDGMTTWLIDRAQPNIRISETRIVNNYNDIGKVTMELCGKAFKLNPDDGPVA